MVLRIKKIIITILYFFVIIYCHLIKIFNLCYYEDFRKISKSEFWDNLLLENEIEIKSKLQGINYNDEYTNTFLNNNKYFKLFLYMMFCKDLPKDFDLNKYKKNKNLQNISDIAAIKHYKNV